MHLKFTSFDYRQNEGLCFITNEELILYIIAIKYTSIGYYYDRSYNKTQFYIMKTINVYKTNHTL